MQDGTIPEFVILFSASSNFTIHRLLLRLVFPFQIMVFDC